jgi:hypothetical protein
MYVFVCYGWLTMEAMVADREAEMVEWDDGRLDERFRQIDQRFDQTEKTMDEGFARMDAGFREINSRLDGGLGALNSRFDAMQRTLLGVSGVIIAALIGLIATQI